MPAPASRSPVESDPVIIGEGADSGPLSRVRRRKDFLAANRGVRVVTPAFILLVKPNGENEPRAGFTVSRKVGNAVVRNRTRRRLREMARLALPEIAVPAADHIFIARPQPEEPSFAALTADMQGAVMQAKRKLQRRQDARHAERAGD